MGVVAGKIEGGVSEAAIVTMSKGLCVLDAQPPFSMQCLRQMRQGQSSARQVCPQPETGHLTADEGTIKARGAPGNVG